MYRVSDTKRCKYNDFHQKMQHYLLQDGDYSIDYKITAITITKFFKS